MQLVLSSVMTEILVVHFETQCILRIIFHRTDQEANYGTAFAFHRCRFLSMITEQQWVWWHWVIKNYNCMPSQTETRLFFPFSSSLRPVYLSDNLDRISTGHMLSQQNSWHYLWCGAVMLCSQEIDYKISYKYVRHWVFGKPFNSWLYKSVIIENHSI